MKEHKVKLRKKLGAILFAFALIAGLAACSSSDNSQPVDQTSAAASSEAANAGAGLDLIFTNQPAPVFATSAYRQEFIEIEAVEALGTPTTAFFFPPGWAGNGSHPFKVCPAQGLPIPNSTQLDNPSEIVQDPYGGGYRLNNGGLVKPQADPVGVYTPTTGTGTYVSCVGKGGSLDASYWEGDVFAESAPAIWNTTEGMIQDIGPARLPQCTAVTASATYNPLKLQLGTSYEHCVPAAGTTAKVWGIPRATSHGYVLTARYASQGPLTVRCSLKRASYYDQKSGKFRHDGMTSTCQFPDSTTLTFAPWGIVSHG